MKRILVDMSATLIHHGHIKLLKKAKKYGYLIVALTTDQEIKNKKGYIPELNFEQRKEILLSMRDVDAVVVYQAEDTFISYLDDYDIRFLGSDYANGGFTGATHDIEIVFLDRSHGYSTTALKNKICIGHK